MAYTGQRYQLHSDRQLHSQAYVAINGPWDTYGVVLSSKREKDGRWLNQLLGVKKRAFEKPVYQF